MKNDADDTESQNSIVIAMLGKQMIHGLLQLHDHRQYVDRESPRNRMPCCVNSRRSGTLTTQGISITERNSSSDAEYFSHSTATAEQTRLSVKSSNCFGSGRRKYGGSARC